MGSDVGIKHDDGKNRYDLLPPEALDEITKVFTFGAKKYVPRNWEKGIPYGRVFAAMMRHMWAWWGGEDDDPETGLSHLSHAGCNLFFLLAFVKRVETKNVFRFVDSRKTPSRAGRCEDGEDANCDCA